MATAIITRNYQENAFTYNGDGWFNATEAAKQFGKEPAQWARLPETIKYMDALERKYVGITHSKTKRGANGGTWLHPKLAVRFAQWLDIDFALWCDEQIDSIIRGNTNWANSRHASIGTNKALNMILQDVRADMGKETESHHYANEAKLVNWALCGEFKGLNRNDLNGADLDLLAHLEARNAVLIGRGVVYEQRKPMLKQYAMDWRMSHTPLITE